MSEIQVSEGTSESANRLRRLPVATVAGAVAGLGASSALAQSSNDEFVGEIQDGVADLLGDRGVPYEFDDAPPSAPLPAPPNVIGDGSPVVPVTSSTVEPVDGSSGVPVADPVGTSGFAPVADSESDLGDIGPGEGLALAGGAGGDDNMAFVS